ncbi:FliH/SctL family protein [Aeoliella mucimassa]|uniref:Flagellar assembly protein FliH n=1 Tax=Aeoliella mucimassa TaxID=2527972 RepID=A0A518AKR5_9BACT|nr:FliH/SctL family protein [Aeoliella mucimassa]QDU55319.1 Yop proteins translocation protein L [Aeoliella mucimassa]
MATIIKRGSEQEYFSGQEVRPVAFSFEEMAGRAEEYLESVRREAVKIIQQAHTDAEEVLRKAEAAGRVAAQAAIEEMLEEKINKQMKTLRPALMSVAHQLADARGKWLSEWEGSAVHLAARMAERIIRHELGKEPKAPLKLIRESLELASSSASITIHLSPQDCKHLGAAAADIIDSLKQLAPAKIMADASVSPGGCVVRTEFGEIDQRIESQLERLEQELTN